MGGRKTLLKGDILKMILSLRKILRFFYSCFRSYFIPTPVFLRIISTDRCNLQCQYCYQHNSDSVIMSREEFDKYLTRANKLGASIVSFLGGEPLLWPSIYYAIEQCNRIGMITDINTNGVLLNSDNLEKLGRAGLDFLGISLDALIPLEQSKKDLVSNKELIEKLKLFNRKYKTIIRINAVVTKDNIGHIEELMDLIHQFKYPLSLGFIVPPPGLSQEWNGDGLVFTERDFPVLRKFVGMILQKKKNGYYISDPDAYFKGIFDFIQGKSDWDCGEHQRKFAGVIIAPDGRIRSCTKLMDYSDYKFLDLTPKKIKTIREEESKNISKCNPRCYSNCAYYAYYYSRHKIEFIFKQLVPAFYIKK
jgi:MoaA/NifB/PqqE/SkfB family radical SAM enzyme